jgi:ppGpp synthetase/RelA/SpoT-type nucleotidyltranferase
LDETPAIDWRLWYEEHGPIFGRLADVVRSTLISILSDQKIAFLTVTHRLKDLTSFLEKIQRKEYQDPKSELTDIAGVRVITFTQSEAMKAVDTVRKSFNVHEAHSLDKSTELGVDRVGYRSVHLICDMGIHRCELPEFAPYKELMFEVQVRTVLQHAWAEIEHDRNYKFGGTLPSQFQRRLSLLAGSLESSDNEFDRLTQEIDLYAKNIGSAAKEGNLSFEINSTSLQTYLEQRFGKMDTDAPRIDSGIIEELRAFGVHTLADLDRLIPSNSQQLFPEGHRTFSGTIRRILMAHDLDRYFRDSWNKRWRVVSPDSADVMVAKYGKEKVDNVFRKVGITVRKR